MRKLIKLVKEALLKKYHAHKAASDSVQCYPERLIISKCKWRNNADAPVLFMIDDLTNAYVDDERNPDGIYIGDYGGRRFQEGSILKYIENDLLRGFDEVRTTFFTVVGQMSSFSSGKSFQYAETLDRDHEAIAFFRKLGADPHYEIAYHGLDHGVLSEDGFVQEWDGFETVNDAVAQTRKGLELYRTVFDHYPSGGKFGGYKSNRFGDACIDRCGFEYWCRDWLNERSFFGPNAHLHDFRFFGANNVVDIPSNIHGFWWTKEQIDMLLGRRQVIAIQEHIASKRVDGIIQRPNIVDDHNQLRTLFKYLSGKNVWFATCAEAAAYFLAHSETTIYNVNENMFELRYEGRLCRPILSLLIDCRFLTGKEDRKPRVIAPDGNSTTGIGVPETDGLFIVNLPVVSGKYEIQYNS